MIYSKVFHINGVAGIGKTDSLTIIRNTAKIAAITDTMLFLDRRIFSQQGTQMIVMAAFYVCSRIAAMV